MSFYTSCHTEDAKHYLSAPDGDYLEVEAPTFPSRKDSMYVNLKDDKVISPSDATDEWKRKKMADAAKNAAQFRNRLNGSSAMNLRPCRMGLCIAHLFIYYRK
jgi:hypothetical protein